VNFLKAADYITIIDSGEIVHSQVILYSIDSSLLYGLQNEAKGKGVDFADESSGAVATMRDVEPVVATENTTEAYLTRQPGDSECYKIYFRSIGWPIFITFAALCVELVVMKKMPRKYPVCTDFGHPLTIERNMA
jgi:ATP-binding cassette, subfamily C (CFTR/MRP), member 1